MCIYLLGAVGTAVSSAGLNLYCVEGLSNPNAFEAMVFYFHFNLSPKI